MSAFLFYSFSLGPCRLNSGRGDPRFLKRGEKTRSKIRLWRDRKHNETKTIVYFGDPSLAGQLFSHKRITHLDILVGALLSLDLRMRVLCGNARRLNVI